MSFIQNDALNTLYQPGWFLAHADCKRITAEISASHSQVVTKADGSKYVPAGAVIPANGSTAKGILYEDVDVSTGNMPGSIVTEGTIYADRLPAALDSDAASALTGIKVITAAPAITRPTSFDKSALGAITVTSAEGTGSGKTDVSVSGYTLGSGESYVYKIDASAAPTVTLGEVLPTSGTGAWTSATFPLDELTATDGHKIAVAAVDGTGAAVAYGSATIDSKA
jgi:hypothetical protein